MTAAYRQRGEHVMSDQGRPSQEEMEAFASSLMEYFKTPTWDEPFHRPRIVYRDEWPADRAGQHDDATNITTIFANSRNWKRTIVHEFCHAWVWQRNLPFAHPHGSAFQEKQSRVWHCLGWGLPDKDYRGAKDTPDKFSRDYPLTIEIMGIPGQ